MPHDLKEQYDERRPEQNADARNRGARMDAFQKGPGSKAVVNERRHRVDAHRPGNGK